MENNVMMHINIFGNTKNIVQNEPKVSISRIERIMDMLNQNKHKIDNANHELSDRNSFVHLFHYQDEYRSRLRFYHSVRDRLIRIWNKELERIKL